MNSYKYIERDETICLLCVIKIQGFFW